jgi:hypothetical protein
MYFVVVTTADESNMIRTANFFVFTSRLLAIDLNTETTTSNHYEVFLPYLVKSPWTLGTQLKNTPELFNYTALHCTKPMENSLYC